MTDDSILSLNKYAVSVLIVTFNNASIIADCLDSLRNQSVKDLEILIRDNASSDNPARASNSDVVTLIQGENNIGFGAAINSLADRAACEYLFILNPDCYCPPDTLKKLLEFAGRNSGAISPSLVYPDGSSQASARQLFSYANIVFSRRSPFYQLGLVRASDAGYLDLEQARKVPAVSGTALWIKRELFLSMGGFDERFFMYGEDMDLCKRLADRNIDIWYLPDIKIRHSLGASSSQAAFKSLYYHHVSIYKYFTKHFPEKYIKNTGLLLMLFAGFVAMSILRLLGLSKRK